MKESYYSNSKDYINRWIISYADLVTLLLAFFLLMYAVNNVNKQKINETIPYKKTLIKVQEVNNTKLQQELLYEFKNNNDVLLLKDPRGIIIRLKENTLFGNAESDLQQSSYETLNKIVDILSKNDNSVIIEGHTDNVPIKSKKYLSNWELSSARATRVLEYIVKTKRVNPKRFSAVAYGEYVPVAENTSNSGRIKNRRVDIIILNK